MGKLFAKPKKIMTEKQIQKILINEFGGYDSRRKHKLCIPNIYLYNWESDLISITRSDYITEYEIKCSKWDYLNDFKKQSKHKAFKLLRNIPNYFYYVCPGDMIKKDDIPEYAGLIYVDNVAVTIKKAPILHKDIFEKWEDIAIKIFYKSI